MNSRLLLYFSILGAAAGTWSGCSREAGAPPSTESQQVAADSWDKIKDYAHERRVDLVVALERMADKLDAEVAASNARVTGLPDAAAKQRDRAVKEFNQARAHLKVQLAEVPNGLAGTWLDTRDKVAQAWREVQAACERVKASPTS